MSRLGWLYSALVVLALLGVTAVGVLLYTSGSAAVPRWRAAVAPGPLSAPHAFLGADCEACHAPLKGATAQFCIVCHAGSTTLLAKQSTAFHASIQDCRDCHVEHQGGARSTSMDHAALVRAALNRMPVGSQERPSFWHNVSDNLARSFGGKHLANVESLDCAACHSNRSPHRDLFGRECGACHSTETWLVAGYRHPAPTSTDCIQCHRAPPSHYMMHFHMVSMQVAGQEHARVEQCYLCHQTDSWNDIKGVGWYKHH